MSEHIVHALPARIYGITEAAEKAGFHHRTVRKAFRRGELPFNLVGKKPRFDLAEVRLFVKRADPKTLRTYGVFDHRPGVVYAIRCPDTNRIKYIGKSGNYKQRVAHHLQAWRGGKRRTAGTHLTRWMLKLHRNGKRPVFEVLQECLPGMMDAVEREWIARCEAKGIALCNITEGGEQGQRIGPMGDDVRKRLSEIIKAKWQDPQYRANWKAAMKSVVWPQKLPPEERERRAAARERNLAIHARNMQIAAERRADREAMKTLTLLTVHGRTAIVPLTQGFYAMVNAGDADRVKQHVWFANKNGAQWRARRKLTVDSIQSLSQFVMQPPAGVAVRNISGNQLDCRRANLVLGSELDAIRQAKRRAGLEWHAKCMEIHRLKQARMASVGGS